MGQFSQNEAKSNGHSGFYFYYNKQIPERNILDTLLAVKNRYYGLYLYKAHRMSIYNSIFAENDYNAWTVWSDDIKISDSEIRGVSSMTKSLVSPPYFNRPCTSSSLSQFGYKMQTNMHKIGSDGWEKVKGARLKNVRFSFTCAAPALLPHHCVSPEIRPVSTSVIGLSGTYHCILGDI